MKQVVKANKQEAHLIYFVLIFCETLSNYISSDKGESRSRGGEGWEGKYVKKRKGDEGQKKGRM